MARRTKEQEVTEACSRFFAEAKDGLTRELLKSRQPKRREALFNEIAALDKVEARFYNWQHGVKTDAA